MFPLTVSATEKKYLLKMLAISEGLGIEFFLCKINLGTEDVVLFNVVMDLTPFQILALFEFDSK